MAANAIQAQSRQDEGNENENMYSAFGDFATLNTAMLEGASESESVAADRVSFGSMARVTGWAGRGFAAAGVLTTKDPIAKAFATADFLIGEGLSKAYGPIGTGLAYAYGRVGGTRAAMNSAIRSQTGLNAAGLAQLCYWSK